MRLFLSLFIVISIGATTCLAQSKLYVENKTGVKTTFLLDSVSSVTFEGLSLVVKKSNGAIQRFSVYEIDHIRTVADTTSVLSIEQNLNSNGTVLYPNPVTDQFIVSFSVKQSNTVVIDIVDLNGKVIRNKVINCVGGKCYALFEAHDLPKGTYTCLLHRSGSTQSLKFIKR